MTSITDEDLNDSFDDEDDDEQQIKRKRNRYWVKANEFTKIEHSTWLDVENGDRWAFRRPIAQKICDLGNLYRKTTREQTIWLWGENIDTGERYFHFMKYKTRFSKEYIRDQIRKLNHAFKELEIKGSMIFITLTIDSSKFRSIWQGYKVSQKKVNILLTYLRKTWGVLFRYVKISEIQEKNTYNIHYHIAMSVKGTGYDYNQIEFDKISDQIKSVWNRQKIGFSDVKLVKETKKNGLRNYMLKYMLKSLKSDSENEISLNSAILWALNSRIFSFSNIQRWRERMDLITAEGDKNNSNWALDLDPEAEKIIWEYGGVVYSDQIGNLDGLYAEKDIDPSILELLYKMFFGREYKKDGG